MKLNERKFFSLKEWLRQLNREIDWYLDSYHSWMDIQPLTDFEKHVIVLEDRRFFHHKGIDAKSIVREMLKFITLRRAGGASTIEMQFIRTINNRRERTFYRKFREILLVWLLSFHVKKIALLRSYLSVAFFGSGLIGSRAASELVFGMLPEDLSDEQAAFLASLLVYPRPLRPNDAWQKKVERRARYGLKLKPRFEQMFDEVENRYIF